MNKNYNFHYLQGASPCRGLTFRVKGNFTVDLFLMSAVMLSHQEARELQPVRELRLIDEIGFVLF